MFQLNASVIYAGSKHPARKLFDALIPLPDGTSYNSYLVMGNQKTALIDAVDPGKITDLKDSLAKNKISNLDYIIANHAEQDHSGGIPALLEMFPHAKVVTNAKCKDFLQDLLHLDPSVFLVIQDNQELDLGDKTLRFLFTPWVHWPETMSTYLVEDKILFSCDFFGSHDGNFDLWVEDEAKMLNAAKRYYAEIMMPFAGQVTKNLQKIADLEITMIAPSHGPVHKDPSLIISAYQRWSSPQVKNEVVIPFVSMHGSTAVMVEYLKDKLIQAGIKVHLFDLPDSDIGELAMTLVDAATIILATPTVLAGAHPQAFYAAYLTSILRPKARWMGLIGSYGWGGKTIEQISGLLAGSKAEILEPVLIKGLPKTEDLSQLDQLAEQIIARHQTIQ